MYRQLLLVVLAGLALAAHVPLDFHRGLAQMDGLRPRQDSFSASFTYYGSGDSAGSENCNTHLPACGPGNYQSGFWAAASENLYGSSEGVGSACGTCWKLTPVTDSNGNPITGNEIVVKINNLCPKQGNAPCSQNSLTDTNYVGANVNFDLCKDGGTSAALFGSSGVGMAVGHAVEVDCGQWTA